MRLYAVRWQAHAMYKGDIDRLGARSTSTFPPLASCCTQRTLLPMFCEIYRNYCMF